MKSNHFNFSDISVSCMLRMLLKNLWMIVAAALIFAMGTSLYLSWFHVPVYQATMTYAVTSRRASATTSGSLSATREIAAVLSPMMETEMVLESIRSYSPELADFDGSISASLVGDSNFFVVTSTAKTPEEAFLSLQALKIRFPDIAGYISSNGVVQVLRNPAVSTTPINRTDVNGNSIKIGLLGGAAMAVLLCWMSIRRETIQTSAGARHLLDSNILATIPRVRRKHRLFDRNSSKKENVQVFSPTATFQYTEQINTICAQLEFEANTNNRKLFLVSGVGESEGKSTIAGNVAAALAQMGKRVAIVDCDLRNPSLHRFFDEKYTPPLPLNEFLAAPFNRESLLQCMIRHEQLGLFMLLPLTPDRRCAELLTGATMQTLLHQLRVFDFVILDTPPMGYFADTESLMDQVDATMLVVRQDKTPACDINDAVDLLRRAKSQFLGCILNDMTASLTEGKRYGYGYGHYGHYGYGSRSGSSRKHS